MSKLTKAQLAQLAQLVAAAVAQATAPAAAAAAPKVAKVMPESMRAMLERKHTVGKVVLNPDALENLPEGTTRVVLSSFDRLYCYAGTKQVGEAAQCSAEDAAWFRANAQLA